MARELILKLGKKITDRVDVKLGMTNTSLNPLRSKFIPKSATISYPNLKNSPHNRFRAEFSRRRPPCKSKATLW